MAKKKDTSRNRSDTFWKHTSESNGALFDSIYKGENPNYYLDASVVKKDYRGKDRFCWRLMSVQTGRPAASIRSTKPYRLAMVWCTHTKTDLLSPNRTARLKEQLPLITTKRGDHSRHRCGHEWCCNPQHIQIGSRVANEKDKHFHYFLNHPDTSVRDRFRETFADLMKRQRVW